MKLVFLWLAFLAVAIQSLSAQTLLSQNQPATASSYQSGNNPTNGNDGNLSSRWTAAASTFPQWWQVDLGSAYNLNQVVINWYNTTSRAYQYQIFVSTDGVNYSLLVNNTNNTTFSDTTNNFSATARYVQMYVTGTTSAGGYASFYECKVYGTPLPPLSPYTPDANTLVLFHFNEAAGGSVTTNKGTLGGNAYSVNTSTATTTPPTVTDVLGAAGSTNFGNAATFAPWELIGFDNNHNGRYDGDVSASQLSADNLPMSALNMGNGSQTPWTIEAIINPSAITTTNQEIICTDSSASATTSRGFQFRITNQGQLELNLIAITGGDIKTAIPTTATDPINGFVSNNWYHVAATYDGTNVVLYWTLLSSAISAANPISTNALAVGAPFGPVQGPLGIGNRTRGAGSEYFQGLIDEVRISNVARAASQMIFAPGGSLSASTTTLSPANPVYLGTPVTLSSSVYGSQPVGYFWQTDGGSGGVQWTNLPNSVTNTYILATTNLATGSYEFRLVVTNSAGAFTNLPGTLLLQAASGPILVNNTTVTPAMVFAGNSVTFAAAFTGSQPINYQWAVTNSNGLTLVAGATNSIYVIDNAQTNNSGSYLLIASNNPPGLGPQTPASSPAFLTVLPTSSPDSGMYVNLLEHPEQTVISDASPKFSWNYLPSFRNDFQTAYHIIVASSVALANAGTGDMWDSGLVTSSNSLNVTYGGSTLQTGTNYFWRVQTVNSHGQTGAFSAVQQFNTASQLVNPATTSGVIYQQPANGSANCYPLRYASIAPVLITNTAAGVWFVDFGQESFGYVTVQANGAYAGTNVTVGFGEMASGNAVNTSPPSGSSVRYGSATLTLQNGNVVYAVHPPSFNGNPSAQTISPPAGAFGVIMPFRYLQLNNFPGTLTATNITQQRLVTEFDDNAATFNSSSAALNQVWGLCKYSMKALTFDGIFVDGDRERTPYEADTYIHLLSSYAVNNDFTMPRCTFEYLTNHLTWPTEWPMHMIFTAWADYQQTGDTYLMTKYYGFLTNKCMLYNNAGPNGLVLSYPATGNNHASVSDIIDWYRVSGDGLGNIDGYVAGATNAVINAFYYRCLTLMTNIAALTGHATDAANFAARASQVYNSYSNVFWNSSSQSYIDGEGTTHSSADANFYPLAFGLVPRTNQSAVVNYLHTRIASLGAMPAGVYGAQYLLEGLFNAGDADTALGLMTTNNTRSWMNMINLGSTITDEAWSITDKSNEDWNHAWGAAPGNLIPRFVLGVRPLNAGYGQILIQPQLGQTLSFVQGTVPTIRGPVSLMASNVPGQFQLWVNIPGNVVANVMLPAAGATNPVALVDGAVVAGTLSNNWLTVTGIGAGAHAIWVNTNSTPTVATLYNNWAASWFGTNAANPAIAGQTADPDGDGVSNYNEFVASTNPLDSTDAFHITGISYATNGPTASATITGKAGRNYTLQSTPTLNPIVWSNGTTITATNDNQVITLSDTSLSGTTTFLRVLVTYP